MTLENAKELIDLLVKVWGYWLSDILLVEGLDGQLFRRSHVAFGQETDLSKQVDILSRNLGRF